MNLDYEEMWLN